MPGYAQSKVVRSRGTASAGSPRCGGGRMRKFAVGDRVVYQKSKSSPQPGPRAESIWPSGYGEDYAYVVDKYWVVSTIVDEETIEVATRRGKTHRLRVDDPQLRKAGWLARFFHRGRYPSPLNADFTSLK